MRRECAGCAGNTTLSWKYTLCTACYEEHGKNRSRWPDWLLDRARDIQREIDSDRDHDEYEYYDENLTVPGDDWEATYVHYQMTSHGDELSEIEDSIKGLRGK